MSKQRETKWVVEPIVNYMSNLGWEIVKTHGNMYQSALPDLYCFHKKYDARWIECKCLEPSGAGYYVKLSTAQQDRWPSWIANGLKIWFVCGLDLSGAKGVKWVQKEYARLFQEPDGNMYMTPLSRKMAVAKYKNYPYGGQR